MALSKEAKENKPKKPLNSYMFFSTRRFKELGDTENKREVVKKEWDEMSEKDL